MEKKHPAHTKSMPGPATGGDKPPRERDKKKMELGDAMEHQHGPERESTEKDIEDLDEKD